MLRLTSYWTGPSRILYNVAPLQVRARPWRISGCLASSFSLSHRNPSKFPIETRATPKNEHSSVYSRYFSTNNYRLAKMSVEEHEDRVILTHKNGSTVSILKFGANVLSWKTAEGKEQLWLSDGAILDGSKAVRGGVPLVFPIFGKQKDESHPTFPLPQHGFARNSPWEFLGQTKESPLSVEFALLPEQVDPELYKLWGEGKYDFTLILTVELGEELLKTGIEVINSGKIPFDFKWLFHTYLRVPDITDTLVTNLVDAKCFDQLVGEEYVEKAPMVSFHEEFDRIYKDIDTNTVFQTVELGKVLHTVKRTNLPDSVVWNPWIKKSEGMGDFQPKDGYQKMLCIEPGHVNKFVTLAPGDKWSGAQEIATGGNINVQTNIF